jgi:hypothetical protein
MLPLDFFRQPTFTAATLIGLAVNFTLYGVIFILGLYLQRIRGYSPVMSGLMFLPFPIGRGIGSSEQRATSWWSAWRSSLWSPAK